MRLTIEPIDGPLGAQVRADSPSDLVTPEAGKLLRGALAQYGLLVLRGLGLDDEGQVALAHQFGDLQAFGTSELFRSANIDEDGALRPIDSDSMRLLRLNRLWHTDGPYRTRPVEAVVLRAERFEPGCSDTEFADLAAAYEALAPNLRMRIEGLEVEFSFEHLVRHQDVPQLSPGEAERLPSARHALVRHLPDGRHSLMLSRPYMKAVVGWGEAESQALFDELMQTAARPQHIHRHRWRQGDVVVWTNSWTMHRVLACADERLPRVMRGAVITGPAGT